ncbi:hypothetical protein CSUI_005584, partial [Cystoisospora suis]
YSTPHRVLASHGSGAFYDVLDLRTASSEDSVIGSSAGSPQRFSPRQLPQNRTKPTCTCQRLAPPKGRAEIAVTERILQELPKFHREPAPNIEGRHRRQLLQ